MRICASILVVICGTAASPGYDDLPGIEYRGSLAVLKEGWREPAPMPRSDALYWGSYLFAANTPAQAPYRARSGISIVRAGAIASTEFVQDLDCRDIAGSVAITGADPHGFDGDNDGMGCEGNQ